MWLISSLRARKFLKLTNFYNQKLPQETTVIFIFLMPKIMPRVKQYLATQKLPNAKYILAYAFPFPDVTPEKIIKTPKAAPLYIYAARDILPPHE